MPANRFTVDDFIKQHRYINYCEAIVFENGDVCYAIPSHQQYMMNLFVGYDILSADDAARDAAYQKVEYMSIECLLDATRCALTWYDRYMLSSACSLAQLATIERLKLIGAMSSDAFNSQPISFEVTHNGSGFTVLL